MDVSGADWIVREADVGAKKDVLKGSDAGEIYIPTRPCKRSHQVRAPRPANLSHSFVATSLWFLEVTH